MARSTAQQLAAHERRYRDLAAQLADIGYITSGSITQRHTRCANPNCRCHADPPQPHGPYWQWTAKIDGKTVTRRLTQTEADLYQQWIDNDRQLRQTIAQMREIAAQATGLLLKNKTQNRQG
jgi:alkanesulfonate monooxygenase SsuD/methylene tetrahydromethanopterin reductase-like flavin-dependent oxidoreductase (luciferase family)